MDAHIIFWKRLPWRGNMPLFITTAAPALAEEPELPNNKEPRKAVHELRKWKKRKAPIMLCLHLARNMNTKRDLQITINQRLEVPFPCRPILIHPCNNQWLIHRRRTPVTWDNRTRVPLALILGLRRRMERHIRTQEDTECKLATLLSGHTNTTALECTMASVPE